MLQLRYRHVHLGDAALQEDSGRPFLSLELPPPVRTILIAGDRAFEVESVVESDAAPAGRGCYIRPAEMPTRFPVGSEGLAPHDASNASSLGDAVRPVGDDEDLDYGARMAVPAPVVDMDGTDSSGQIDNGGDDADEASEGDAGSDTNGVSKKRRGRKRR